MRHPDDYNALPEHTKEYDRVLARFILEREQAQERRIAELERDWRPANADDPVETLVVTTRLQGWLRQIVEQQSEIDRLRELLGASHTVLTDADSITSLVAYRHHRGRCDKGHPWELPSDVVDDLKATSTRARGLSERIEAALSERPK